MTTIEYNKQKISVPDNWADIKLGTYEKITKAKPTTAREQVKTIATACAIDENVLLEWPKDIFTRVLDIISFMFNEDAGEPSPAVIAGGVTYVVPLEDKLSLGAYIDAEEAQKGDNPLSETLAIVCRPAGEAYDPDLTDERAAMFAALSVLDVRGVLAFFLQRKTAYEKLTRDYLCLVQLCDQLPPNIPRSQSHGVGTRLLTILPRAKYKTLIRLLRSELQLFSRSFNLGAIKK